MQRPLAIAIAVVLIILGITLQADPYRIRDPGFPADQQVLDFRDSTYTHISWVTSEASNYAQLRFYDRVEGGVCLRPQWSDLTTPHLKMPADYQIETVAPAPTWPAGMEVPNPGTLSNTKYICMYPLSVLLNQRLMAEAKGDAAKAAPNILIVGLGSGVGVGMFAHHFPEASITVVDIDQKVIDMVRDHYPMLRWLEQDAPPTADGRKRLRLIAADARQAVIYPELHGSERPFDVVVLDAYTSGSTIPPHLMTREFFQEVKGAMSEDGIMLSNIIGSYRGDKRLLLGGAIRTMHAAGLTEVHNFPIYYFNNGETKPEFGPDQEKEVRNNVVLASKMPLDPRGNRDGWKAIHDFIKSGAPYADLPTKRYRSVLATLVFDDTASMSTSLITQDGNAIDGAVYQAISKAYGNQPHDYRRYFRINERGLIGKTVAAVREHAAATDSEVPQGWTRDDAVALSVIFIDWVHHARSTFRASVSIAEVPATPTRFAHSGRHLVGPSEEERAEMAEPDWVILDAPLFTDGTPNADIFNN
ncbi:MAG: fused MFS/spermidine synthase [Planctomycetota bacterium]|jgi:hypothetical protein|nr:fused MFS/spermidine synthase [Planctomycetota bacterium]